MADESRGCRVHSDILVNLNNLDKELGAVVTPDTELVLRFRDGDQAAGHDLFRKHYKMILKVVLSATKNRWFSDDCFQSGAIGLYEAAKRFDPNLGYTFLTYAVPWIRKYVLLEVTNSVIPARGIHFSANFRDKLYVYISHAMVGKSDEEIMELMRINEKLLRDLSVAAFTASQPLTLEAMTDEDTNSNSYSVEPSSGENIEDDVANEQSFQELKSIIEGYAESLDEVSCFILKEALGYNDGPKLKPHQIAKKFCMSTKQVHDLKEEALRALRKNLVKLDRVPSSLPPGVKDVEDES